MIKIALKYPCLLGLALGLSACTHEKPNVIYMPDMVYSPALSAQQEGSMRMPVKGTIPRGFEPYRYKDNPDLAGVELKNPLRPTKVNLARGEAVYKTNCMLCHGPKGDGDGPIIAKGFPRPPALSNEKVVKWSDGRIFHVTTVGQNNMPGYGAQISAGNRWAAVLYVRAIQRSKHPTPQDIKLAEQEN